MAVSLRRKPSLSASKIAIKETSGKFSATGSIIASVVGMLSGVLSVIFGFVVMALSDGYYESSQSYGGDAYTGIQNAAAQTANNVEDLAVIAKNGMGFLLIVLGIAIACYFMLKLFSCTKKGE